MYSDPETHANLLMLVIVGIDSLLTMVETRIMACGTCGPNLGLALAPCPSLDFGLDGGVDASVDLSMGIWGIELDNPIDEGYGVNTNSCNNTSIAIAGISGVASGGGGASNVNQFKPQLDTSPFLVGNLQVPLHETKNFIKNVLDARLSTLLCTVRKIKQYTQQMLGPSFGKARLIMIRETDQRMQSVIMNIRMWA